jgi:hypothetical protein
MGAFVGNRADIDVFTMSILLHQLHRKLAKLIDGVGDVDLEQAAVTEQAPVVVLDAKEVYRFLLCIPVPPNPLKASGAVVKGMSHYPDLGLVERHELAIEKGIGSHLVSSADDSWPIINSSPWLDNPQFA